MSMLKQTNYEIRESLQQFAVDYFNLELNNCNTLQALLSILVRRKPVIRRDPTTPSAAQATASAGVRVARATAATRDDRDRNCKEVVRRARTSTQTAIDAKLRGGLQNRFAKVAPR